MKLPEIVILDEKEKILHEKAKPVTEFPLAKEDQKKIEDMIKYLTMSQIEEYAEKYGKYYYNEKNGIVLTRANSRTLKALEKMQLIEIIEDGKSYTDMIKILNY